MRQLTWSLPEVAALLRELRIPSPARGQGSVLQPLAHRVNFLFELTDRRLAGAGLSEVFAPAVLDRARAAALDLASGGTMGLVHGDLHPANVLSGPGQHMVAIGPRPALGDPDSDAVDWMMAGVEEFAELERSVEEFSSAGSRPNCRSRTGLVPRRCCHGCSLQALCGSGRRRAPVPRGVGSRLSDDSLAVFGHVDRRQVQLHDPYGAVPGRAAGRPRTLPRAAGCSRRRTISSCCAARRETASSLNVVSSATVSSR